MKILIVDDNVQRFGKAIAHLTAAGICRREDIDVETNGMAARQALARQFYDLLILDVLLPQRAEDDPDPKSAVAILTEIAETSRLKKPRHIIGLTAYEEAEREVARDFEQRAWVLIRTSEDSDSWLETIESAARYIEEHEGQAADPSFDVDVVVITALRSEMDAVKRLPWEWSADQALDDSQFYARGRFEANGRQRTVIAAVASRMGMVATCVLASKLISRFRPRLVVMPGICAGVRDKTNLGDVLCADTAWDYQSGKHVFTANAIPTFLMDPNFIPVDAAVVARCDQLAQDDALSVEIWRGWEPKAHAPPKLICGPVASGSAVIADRRVTESVQSQQRKLVGIEMELYGLYVAAQQAARPRPVVLGLKGVCDFADEEKSDGAQAYAAYVSANYLRQFCERYIGDF